MKNLKYIFISLFIIFSSYLYSFDSVPKLFQMEWGAYYNEVIAKMNRANIGFNGELSFYNAGGTLNEKTSLRDAAFVRYYTKASPFFNIPGEIIFKFYNTNGKKSDLRLSKIEVLLEKKDNKRLWVDIKEVYKNFILIFLDNYNINLQYSRERQIFTDYSYQVTINGVHVNFIANVGENILDNNVSIFISYESNTYENMILKKEMDNSKEFDLPKDNSQEVYRDTMNNL